MDRQYKEVRFDIYCNGDPDASIVPCKHRLTPDIEEPCNSCLCNPANENSHKPVMYEEEK